MEIPFKGSLHEIDETFNEYMEIADCIYKEKTINQEKIDKILSYYNNFERLDETNLIQSTLDVKNKIKEIKNKVDKQIYKTCSRQIETITRLSKNKIQIRFQVNHLTDEYEKCIRILLILLRKKIALITTKEPLKPSKKIVPIQTRIPKADKQEIQEMQRLQDKFNQESQDKRLAIRKQQEYDRIMAQKIHDRQLAEQLHKEEQQEKDDYLLAYFLQRHPSARAIRRLTRKQKPKPKKKTPKEDKKLKKLVKKQTKEKKQKKERKQRKEQDTKKKQDTKKSNIYKNTRQ